MDEQTPNIKHRRRPIVAAILSFIVTGLGYIYCGRIVKGLFAPFIGMIFVPVITSVILAKLSRLNMVIIEASIYISLLIWLVSIIDSYRIARRTRPDYELKEYNRWYVYVVFYILIVICAKEIIFGIKSNLMEAFRTSSLSMFPTIEYHDRFLANKIAYKNADPQRGDVIVFISPENRRQNNVKRVVAVAGDTVEIKDNQFYVNGEMLERKSMGRTSYYDSKRKVEGESFTEKNGQAEYEIFIADTNSNEIHSLADFPKTTIPAQHCFVLGDNRNYSHDSRHYGLVPLATVKGRADYHYCLVKFWLGFEKIK